MIYLLIFLLELLFLWRLSRVVNTRIYHTLPFYFYSLLFLPGTFIHELSHFVMAKLLLVRVGRFSIRPKKHEQEVVLGSVAIEKVDIVRRLMIGAAPVFFGIIILFLAIYISVSNTFYKDWKITFFVSYLVFSIGNTMFSSKKDIEGAWKVALATVLIFLVFNVFGVRFYFENDSVLMVKIVEVVKLANLYFLVPIFIDLVIVACYSLKNEIS